MSKAENHSKIIAPPNNLRLYRERALLTQQELADRVNPPMSAIGIGIIERRYAKPRFKTMRAIAEALKVDVNELFPLPEEDAKSAGNFSLSVA